VMLVHCFPVRKFRCSHRRLIVEPVAKGGGAVPDLLLETLEVADEFSVEPLGARSK
jgi:hypothetical protein